MDEVVKWVKEILTSLDLPVLAPYTPIILFFILGSGAGVLTALWKLIKKLVQFVKHRKVSRDLHPFFTAIEIKNHTQYYVPTQCQNIAPSKEDEPGRTHAFATKEKIIPFFLKKGFKYDSDDQRFYIILADSGMGKTTFMINLYIKYFCQWWGKKCAIKLMPLGFPDIDRELDKIEDKERENTILLLDAFDEDRLAVVDYRKRMNEILNKTFRFRKVIITCRTQFFPSEEEEPGETGILKFGDPGGYHIFRKLYVSPFGEKDIKKYLGKRFSIFNFKKKRMALKIVKQSPNLMVRPMLLNYIEDLLKSSRRYEFTFQVYDELIKLWIERESRRYKRDEREGFKKELYKFSREIALDIYRNRETRRGLIINAEEIKPFARGHDIRLGGMEMKSRSLLNRNARREYKFSHKSVLEYFLALEIRQNSKFDKTFSFEGMDQARSFHSDMRKEYTFKFLTQDNLKGLYRVEGQKKPKELSKIKLNELESLEYLNLINNNLTDISPLKELKKLEHLYINGNPVPVYQIKALCQALPRCHIYHYPVP
jgi:hypothetical protein